MLNNPDLFLKNQERLFQNKELSLFWNEFKEPLSKKQSKERNKKKIARKQRQKQRKI